jgi:hypothetical protein
MLLLENTTLSQNDYNPYQDFTGQDASTEDHILGYTGEFQWLLYDDHHWYGYGVTIFNFELTYRIELVSFPFVSDYSRTSEIENGPRILGMPQYDDEENSWSTFNGLETLPLRLEREGAFVRGDATYLGLDTPFTLESIIFRKLAIYGYLEYNIFPQSVYKFTVYAMCNGSAIDSLSYLVDLTRGQMKYYPFDDENYAPSPSSSVDLYDVFVNLKTILADFYATENDLNTISYFSYDEIEYAYCDDAYSTIDPLDPVDDESIYIRLSPYSLTTFDICSGREFDPVGFIADGDLGVELVPIGGIEQHYYIDKSINLSLLNPSQKIIYNPSEVEIGNTVTPVTLTFPSGYSFLTVRGVYPTMAETMFGADVYCDVAASPSIEDVRNIPTDLDPSVYTLTHGTMLSIEPCVTIMDAEIVVTPGTTLQYYPDKTWGNFTINNTGGSVVALTDDVMCNDCHCMQEYDLINPVITTTTTWDSDKFILGKVLVKNGAILNIRNGATILFADSKRTSKNGYSFNGIEVEKGARLNVTENALLDIISCDQMWDGILVHGDHTKEQPVSLPSLHPDFGIINLHNATISHARVGVYSYSATHLAEFPIQWFPAFKKGSGIIKAFKTTFSNNAISVFYGPYKFDHRYELNECTFINDELLRDQESFPQRSLVAHVVAYESRNLHFPGCVFKNTAPMLNSDYTGEQAFLGNYPRGTGVLAFDSEVIIAAKPGITIKYPYFEGMHSGVHSQCWTGFPDGLQVSQAIFNDVPKGITVLGSDYDEIIGCTFTLPVNYLSVIEGAISKTYGTDVWAVYHHGGINPLITQNTINGTSYYENIDTDETDATISSYGIVVGSSYAGSMVYKNTSSGVHTGVQTEYSNEALTISCNDYTGHQLAWNIGEPVDFDPTTYTTPSLANQGEACIPVLSTIINTFTGNAADIYSNVAFDYFAFGAEGTPTGPIANDVAGVDYCDYPTDPSVYCPDMEVLLVDLDIGPIPEIAGTISNISDLRMQQNMLHLYIRKYMSANQVDSVIALLELLNMGYNDPLQFHLMLSQEDTSKCYTLLNNYPNVSWEEKNFRKLGKVITDMRTTGRTGSELTSQELNKLEQVTQYGGYLPVRAGALLDANNFHQTAAAALESDTIFLRKQEDVNSSNEGLVCIPNPISMTNPSVLLRAKDAAIREVQVWNLQGQPCEFEWEPYGHEARLQLYPTAPGIYFIRAALSTSGQEMYTKIVVQ